VAEPELYRAAQEYADIFNRIEPEAIAVVIDEAVVDRYWDDRTNLFLLAAADPKEVALVLATEPDSDDYLVVRWLGEWVVDAAPVDWDAMEAALDNASDGFDDDKF
jgi:hypothetical protein